MYYIIFFLAVFLIGYLLNRYFCIEVYIKPKKKNAQISNSLPKEKLSEEVTNIQLMLEELKNNGDLGIRISNSVKNGMLEIAQLKDWHKKIDQETMENLSKICSKWQRAKVKSSQSAIRVASTGGFEDMKYWEGTEEEYLKALENNEIDENTKVCIYKESNEKYLIKEDGSYEPVYVD